MKSLFIALLLFFSASSVFAQDTGAGQTSINDTTRVMKAGGLAFHTKWKQLKLKEIGAFVRNSVDASKFIYYAKTPKAIAGIIGVPLPIILSANRSVSRSVEEYNHGIQRLTTKKRIKPQLDLYYDQNTVGFAINF